MGPEVGELEKKVARFCGRQYAVGVCSGTQALFLALKSLGIGRGDEVLTTSLSWIATANAIRLTGASPVFADIGDDLNISPESAARLCARKVKAIIPVHYTGKVADMKGILGISKKWRIPVVEDAAQAFGASLNGRRAGSFGRLGCFSMNPMKVFAGLGEAGMIVTDEKALYEKIAILRYNGMINREICVEPSLNGRLDTLQAAILLERFPEIQKTIAVRKRIVGWYRKLLPPEVCLPAEKPGERDGWYSFTIRTPQRDRLRSYLSEKGIETQIQHRRLMCEQEPYRRCRGESVMASRLVREVLCIPFHEKLSYNDVRYVAESIQSFFS